MTILSIALLLALAPASPVCPGGGTLTYDLNMNAYICTGTPPPSHSILTFMAIIFFIAVAFTVATVLYLSDHPITIHLGRITLQLSTTITFSIAPSQLAVTQSSFSGTVGQPITGSLGITGGTAPFSVTADPASLPPGVTLDPTGNVGGTPTQPGTFTTPIVITDSGA